MSRMHLSRKPQGRKDHRPRIVLTDQSKTHRTVTLANIW